MVIHAAAFSRSPDDARYVGAAIVTSWRIPEPGAEVMPPRRRCVAVWRQGWSHAMDLERPTGEDTSAVEDLIFTSEGNFVFLRGDGSVLVCRQPTANPDNTLDTQWFTIRYHPGPGARFFDDDELTRYLVEIPGGDVLLVVRLSSRSHHPATTSFRVFLHEMREEEEARSDSKFPVSQYPAQWSELHTLSDWLLFVGHGCSRSYRAHDYPGFKGGIYFLDDGKFYDDSVIFGNGRYPCKDNGKWSEGHVERCFRRPYPSDHSAPVWLLP